MEMVKVDGHYLGITPANNFFGHGFYQLSPELYFSVFTRDNGFDLVDMIAFEDVPKAPWYRVKSPREAGNRVTLINSLPVYLLVIARKVGDVSVFEATPQQSDYVSSWQQKGAARSLIDAPLEAGAKRLSPLGYVKRIIPGPIKKLLKAVLGRSESLTGPVQGFDPRYFRPLNQACVQLARERRR
jgi:hypothetical protein